MNPQPIRFLHRGQLVQVSAAHTTRTVLEWLRETARCTGTKEGCNEGDCGACTVVIGELVAESDSDSNSNSNANSNGAPVGLSLRSINSCIRFLPSLNGKALFTVEDLKTIAGGSLHPVQQAMVDCHGSQCGFCTPGFVMSLWQVYERQQSQAEADSHHPLSTRQQLADELSGNLCRCTGYRPILDAGQRMFELPAVRMDRAGVIAALMALREEPCIQKSFHYAAASLAGSESLAGPAFQTGSLRPSSARPLDEVGVVDAHRIDHYHAPATADELAVLREDNPGARLLAGGTDIGLWITKQFLDVGDLIDIGNVAELKRIEERDGLLSIGAGASLEEAWRALAARFESLTEVWLRFASPPLRNAGTMGGNVANGSPIGDAPPVLMALDARVELRKGASLRELPLSEFYTGYMKNQLVPGEFVQRLLVPLPQAQVGTLLVRAYKISKRFDSDISAVCAAFAIRLDGDVVISARLAFGGMAAVVQRAAAAEAALTSQPWNQTTIDAAKAALASEFTPLTDMRASGDYRMQVAQNLLQRFWLETRARNALPPQAISVWSAMPHQVSATR